MKKNYKSILLFLAAFSITLFSTSCMKEPDLNQNFGPETSVEEINSTFEKIPTAPISSLQEGEFVYYENSNKIESLPQQVYKQKSKTLTSKVDCLNKKDSSGNPLPKPSVCNEKMPGRNGYWITFTNEYREMDGNGNMKPSVDVETGAILVSEQNLSSIEMKALPPADLGTQSGVLQDLSWKKVVAYGSSPSGRKYTYHNLRVQNAHFVPPLLVQKRSDCGGLGLENCSVPLRATEVRFDGVDWTGDQPVRTNFVYWMSPDVPITAAQILACASSTVAYSGSRIAVTQCSEAKDFTFGTKPTTATP